MSVRVVIWEHYERSRFKNAEITTRQCIPKGHAHALPSATKAGSTLYKILYYSGSKARRACADNRPDRDFSSGSDWKIQCWLRQKISCSTYFLTDARDTHIRSNILSRKNKNHYKLFAFYLL